MEPQPDPSGSNRKTIRNCADCQIFLSHAKTKPYALKTGIGAQIRRLLEEIKGAAIAENEFVCGKCYARNKKTVQNQSHERSPPDSTTASPSPSQNTTPTSSQQSLVSNSSQESVDEEEQRQSSVTVMKIKGTEENCFVCNCSDSQNRVDESLRRTIFTTRRLYVPPNYQCCGKHYSGNGELTQTDMSLLTPDFKVTLEGEEYDWFFNLICETPVNSSIEPFDRDEDYKIFTGLTKIQFNLIHDKYIIKLRSTKSRTTQQALAIYLTKLRTGETNKELTRFLRMSETGITKIVRSVREELNKNMVGHSFSPKEWTRELIELHQSKMVSALHCESGELATMWDGTYSYIQKSNNNEFQRKTYSVQKGCPLIKPMIAISADGYILGVFGPYKASQNDASIMDEIITKYSNDFKRVFKNRDVFIVDRGFRDAKVLKDNYRVAMPTCVPPKQAQLTPLEANETRKVTKVRYKIEVVNGILKRFKLLANKRFNSMIDSTMDDWRIAAAIYNEFFKPIESDKDLGDFISERMNALVNTDCKLKDTALALDRKRSESTWKTFDQSAITDFPRLDEHNIMCFTLGSYQIKRCKSYVLEHISKSSKSEFYLQYCTFKDVRNLIRVKIQSRHTESKSYNVYIKYEPNGHGYESIEGYYCKCKSGCRTVGCCSHVCAIVWYLSYARHNNVNLQNYRNLSSIFDTEEEEMSENEDILE